ncbi:uncharacterized protein DSM5745_00752 [Aspergillus mulundensis]|uniref:Uncharacterized protein n=1 Tax=Aspergillus mulundensis TaxID=1810919 RepID=A0A3D8T4G8_9EURO|nr:hypothetical protein DSM5745_00752 [Aspergillus mulundensis]RDW93430.1 hypothetical protein DSM5745_00752 [Aspergillus mulundensis]
MNNGVSSTSPNNADPTFEPGSDFDREDPGQVVSNLGPKTTRDEFQLDSWPVRTLLPLHFNLPLCVNVPFSQHKKARHTSFSKKGATATEPTANTFATKSAKYSPTQTLDQMDNNHNTHKAQLNKALLLEQHPKYYRPAAGESNEVDRAGEKKWDGIDGEKTGRQLSYVERLNRKDHQIASLQGEVSSLQDQVLSLRLNLEDREVASLQGKLSSLQDQISSLQQRMDCLEGENNKTDATGHPMQDQISSLQKRIDKLEEENNAAEVNGQTLLGCVTRFIKDLIRTGLFTEVEPTA